MSHTEQWHSIEEMDMFKRLEHLADEIWEVVVAWIPLAQETIGAQLIRAADSVGANLLEGDGRYHFREKLNFCYIARASSNEARYWIRRAKTRRLMTPRQADDFHGRLVAVHRWINTLITERRRWVAGVREQQGEYAPWPAEPPDTHPGP
jgi:four helix bundle protein